jgi:hypothetical protein
MNKSYVRKKVSDEALVAESPQMSSHISFGLMGKSDNESNVISVFHGIYVSQREIVQTEISPQRTLIPLVL